MAFPNNNINPGYIHYDVDTSRAYMYKGGNATDLINSWTEIDLALTPDIFVKQADPMVLDKVTDPWIDVRAYGSIQNAVNAAANKTLVFPSGTYNMGLVTINNPMAIIALGKVTINLTGTNARFRVDSPITWLILRDLNFNGSGVLADNHYALAPNNSAVIIQDLLIDNCSASNVVNGFDTSSAKRVVMIAPKVMTTVGESSGQGYGIVAGGGNGNYSEDIFIIAPYLYRTTRHGIYLGATKRAQIVSPIFYQHRNGSAGWSYRSALALSRGEDIAVSNPQFINCADECIGLDDDDTVTGQADSFIINGGSIRNSQDVCRALRVGTFSVPSADASVKRIAIRNLTVELNTNLSGTNRDIYVLDGTDVLIDSLHVDGAQAYVSAKEIIYIEGNGSFYGAVTIQNISGRITGSSTKSLVRIDDAICIGTREVNVLNNTITGLSTGNSSGLLAYNTPITNINVRTDSKQEIGISGATPTVGLGERFVMTQVGATNVTNFLGGLEGDEITIRFNDNNSTIKATNIYLQGGIDFVATLHDMLTIQYRGGSWRENSRSIN